MCLLAEATEAVEGGGGARPLEYCELRQTRRDKPVRVLARRHQKNEDRCAAVAFVPACSRVNGCFWWLCVTLGVGLVYVRALVLLGA